MNGFFYVAGTIIFTVYGLLILKWRMASQGALPAGFQEKIHYFAGVLFDPFVISGLVSAFVAALFWIAAMTKFDLSYAYPFMSLSFVLVVFLSVWLFNEPLTMQKALGLLFIVTGVVIAGRSL